MSLETLSKPISKQKSITKKKTKTYTKELTFIDLCSGIGGGRLGLEKQGFKCINFSEIDSKAIHSYRLLHGDEHNGLGDLCNISSNDILDIDLIIAGFPCQSYSKVLMWHNQAKDPCKAYHIIELEY